MLLRMSSVLALQRSRLGCQPMKPLRGLAKNNYNCGVCTQAYWVMRSVQQDVVGSIQFCPHNHMTDTGHAWNSCRAPQLVHERSRRIVLEFLPRMQAMLRTRTLIKSSPDLFMTHIYIILLCIIQQWPWDRVGVRVGQVWVSSSSYICTCKVQCVPQRLARCPQRLPRTLPVARRHLPPALA